MKAKKISGGSAVLGQFMLLLFFVPFIGVLVFFMTGLNSTWEEIAILLFFVLIISLIVYNGFTYSDVYSKDGVLITKKLFSSKERMVGDLRKIGRSAFPLKYYLAFSDGTKVFFSRDIPGLVKDSFKLNTDYLKELKSTIYSH